MAGIPEKPDEVKDFIEKAAPVAMKAAKYSPVIICALLFFLTYGCVACVTDTVYHVRLQRKIMKDNLVTTEQLEKDIKELEKRMLECQLDEGNVILPAK